MLRSHHHLRGFIQTSLLCEWTLVYPVGYVGVGFEGNCDCRYGILCVPMLGDGYVGLGIYIRLFNKEVVKT